jgi:hypothetical protein
MAVGTNDDVSNKSPSMAKSDPKESDGESQGKGSLSDLIASTRKALFESSPPADDKQTDATTQTRKWVRISKTGGSKKDYTVTLGIGRREASIAEGTNFAAKDAPAKKTPAKDTSAKVNDCMVKVNQNSTWGEQPPEDSSWDDGSLSHNPTQTQ